MMSSIFSRVFYIIDLLTVNGFMFAFNCRMKEHNLCISIALYSLFYILNAFSFLIVVQGMDVVPTDVAAGLVLLYHATQKRRSLYVPRSPENSQNHNENHDVENRDEKVNKNGSIQAENLADIICEIDSDEEYHGRPQCSGDNNRQSNSTTVENIQRTSENTPDLAASFEDDEWTKIGVLVHYMKFALACYGWPLYVMMHLKTGPCHFCQIFGCSRYVI